MYLIPSTPLPRLTCQESRCHPWQPSVNSCISNIICLSACFHWWNISLHRLQTILLFSFTPRSHHTLILVTLFSLVFHKFPSTNFNITRSLSINYITPIHWEVHWLPVKLISFQFWFRDSGSHLRLFMYWALDNSLTRTSPRPPTIMFPDLLVFTPVLRDY